MTNTNHIKPLKVALSILPVVAGVIFMSVSASEAGNNREYYRCAKFSMSVLNACLDTARRDRNKKRQCHRHYQDNLVRCQAATR